MVRERANDPYPSGKDRGGESAGGTVDYLRYIVVAVAIVLIVLGISLGMSAFTMVRGIIEGPETLAAHLDAWVGPADRAREGSAAESASESAVAPPPTESSGDTEESAATPGTEPVATPPEGEREQRVARTREATQRTESSKDNEWIGLIDEFFQLLRDGGMSRAVGALFILLFTVVLVRIPFGFLRAGISLLTNAAFPKAK